MNSTTKHKGSDNVISSIKQIFEPSKYIFNIFRLLIKSPVGFTILYVILCIMGIAYNWILLKKFGISVLDYAEVQDLLLAGIDNIIVYLFIIVFSAFTFWMPLLIIYLVIFILTWIVANLSNLLAKNIILKTDNLLSPIIKVMNYLVAISWFCLLFWAFADGESDSIREGRGDRVILKATTQKNMLSPSSSHNNDLILIGTEGKFAFIYNRVKLFSIESTPKIINHLNQVPLANIELNFKDDLNRSYISEGLRKVFQDHSILLSPETNITVKDNDEEWMISDSQWTFQLIKEDSKIQLYRYGLPTDLKSAFRKNAIYVPEDSRTYIGEHGVRWTIVHNKTESKGFMRYLVERNNERLDFYERDKTEGLVYIVPIGNVEAIKVSSGYGLKSDLIVRNVKSFFD